MRKTALRIAAVALACFGLAVGTAKADDSFPSRPIQIIVPFAAGGSIDITFRLMAPVLGKILNTSVVVVNRPGGAATIGMVQVQHSAPDGYTLGAASFNFAADPALLKSMPYDPLTDFAPITEATQEATLLLVNPSTPVHSVKEFIDWVKSKPPGSMNFGSVGVGSSGHLFGALFLSRAGLDMKHVPFVDNAFAPLASGLEQMLFGPIPSSTPWLKDGKLRALAVSSLKPDPLVPGMPTISETLPGFEAYEWPSLVAPKGTPRPVIDKIRNAVVQAMKDPMLEKQLAEVGSEPVGSTPEQFHDFLAQQIKVWGQVIKDAGVTPQ